MRLKEYSGLEERTITASMIASTECLEAIIPIWNDDGFECKHLNVIARLCKKHYDECGEAPGMAITDHLAEYYGETNTDKEVIQKIDSFLEDLSQDWERSKDKFNLAHVKAMATTKIRKNRIKSLINHASQEVEQGNFDKVEERILTFSPLRGEETKLIDVFLDKEAIKAAMSYSKEESIIDFKQEGLNKFFGSSLRRGNFVSFMGPDKSGKSFWLIDLAYRAMCQRHRVMFFESGDMTQNQTIERLLVRNSGVPSMPSEYNFPKRFIEGDQIQVGAVPRKKSALDIEKALADADRVQRQDIKSTRSYFKLACHPNSTLKVSDMKTILQKEARKGWVAEIVIVDYADILCPPSGIEQSRDQSNAIWKQLRALSQELNCLVVTASQSNAKGYKSDVLDRTNFSEDKRKLAHVTGMIGLNVSSSDKDQGLTRLNWIELRDQPFNDRRVCYVAGCFALARPAIISKF